MLSGFQGVKYGLTVPKKDSKAAPKKLLAAFADDDSEDEQQKVANAIERAALRKQSDHKVAKMQAAALEEDPTIFEYDSHYDAKQSQIEAAKPSGKVVRKSRYIESLLDKTKERQREQDIIYERKLLRERKAEDHLFGDKDKFVTGAYKKKLEEDKKWLEEEALRDKVEEDEDVRKRGHMGDFYRNLLTKNVDFGGAQPSQAKPTAPARPPAVAQPSQLADPKWEEMRRAREAYEERTARAGGGAASAAVGGAAKTDGGASAAVGRAPETGAVPPAIQPAADKTEIRGAVGEPSSEGQTDQATEPEPPMSKEDKAAAAKERYLARKRKAPA